MKDGLIQLFTDLLNEKNITAGEPLINRSENPIHGEYTTNIAMVLTKQLKQNPLDIAHMLQATLTEWVQSDEHTKKYPILLSIGKIDVVPPGFINIFLTTETLTTILRNPKDAVQKNKETVMVEFAHPNTHKAFHIGHLRNIITGECIVRLLEASGNKVIRANYQGDVGLHIAKCLYGIQQMDNYELQITNLKTIHDKTNFLASAYVAGNKAFEEDEEAKQKINTINKQIYDKDPDIYPLYRETRSWSLEYFDSIYKRVGSHFDRLYFESETYDIGKNLVLEFVKKGVFEKSDGAIIFPGEKFGLHNRVFITSEGNPTYEGKDIGLAKLQFGEYDPHTIIHCVSSEQIEYFRVIFEAISQVFPETKGKEYHLVYGWVKLKEGKMSSRTGNVVLGEWLLDEVKKAIQSILLAGDRGYTKSEQEDIAEKVTIAAVKYAFLKVSTTQDVSFDIKESININGDSGPYILYTYARCKSVIEKSQQSAAHLASKRSISDQTANGKNDITLNQEEHDVARLLLYFPEIVKESASHFAPNTLCLYLFSLSQTYNLLYAKHQILGNELRMGLTEKTASLLQKGLSLLGIETVERM